MNKQVTVITLVSEQSTVMAGVLNAELIDYVCQRTGLNTQQLQEQLAQLQSKGMISLDAAALH